MSLGFWAVDKDPYMKTVSIADNLRVRGTFRVWETYEGEIDEDLDRAVLLLEDDTEIPITELCEEICEMLWMVDDPDGMEITDTSESTPFQFEGGEFPLNLEKGN